MPNLYYPFSHPSVQMARTKFYGALRKSKSYPPSAIPFEEIYELLKDKTLCLKAIAQRAGLNEDFWLVFYDRNLRSLFGNQSGAERRQAVRREELLKSRLETFENLKELPLFGPVVQQALDAGHTVAPYMEVYKGKKIGQPKRRTLVISGTVCVIHPITSGQKTNSWKQQRYGIVQLKRTTLNMGAIHLFSVLVPNVPQTTFVMPTDEIKAALFQTADVDRERIYIPLKDIPTLRQHTARLNILAARDEWKRIPKQPEPNRDT